MSDSAFPIGGFAHSGGLEAAWQAGRVSEDDSLVSFLHAALQQTAASIAPFVKASHQQPLRIGEWDALVDATLTNHVANRASRAQGKAFIRIVANIYPAEAVASLAKARQGSTHPNHFPVVLGFICQAMNIELAPTLRLFLFQTLRGYISAAVRLGLIGSVDGQAMQWRLSEDAETLVTLATLSSPEEAAQTAPLLDLMQGMQDRLYSRLFQS